MIISPSLGMATNYFLTVSTGVIYVHTHTNTRGPFEKFADWGQCAAVMQKKVVTVMPSCSSGGNIAVA
jgi:hypothetical protein